MKILARAVLYVLALVPGLASCGFEAHPEYGVPIRYVRGKVVTRSAATAIPGVQVQCVDEKGNPIGAAERSTADGSFELTASYCAAVRATDVDGSANGGAFRTTDVVVGTTDVTIPMDPES